MRRFFIAPSDVSDGAVTVRGRDAAHMRTLRMKRGDMFAACDGAETDYICRLTELERDAARAEIALVRACEGEPPVACEVYAAFSKGDRLETVVQKSVELGAVSVVLFESRRCVARPDARALERRLERLSAVAEEAAKQSGRGRVPGVTSARSFEEAVERAAMAALPLFFYEEERARGLREALSGGGTGGSVSVVTGPEGGFEPEEADFAIGRGCVSVSLGPRILRCDTAPVAALACVMMSRGGMETPRNRADRNDLQAD
ncbi:MAG: 16S rRNA (uracil(1498)-N(3))-methyltransferase [Oscillospiraceae bacterium]|jgi:16S rRNA (uracil1498-N3)-methyltransferase|nr:16S rRNA (uracil(1498)-N(3))-methyltransferase [Oscillospiraceae bacterium]